MCLILFNMDSLTLCYIDTNDGRHIKLFKNKNISNKQGQFLLCILYISCRVLPFINGAFYSNNCDYIYKNTIHYEFINNIHINIY